MSAPNEITPEKLLKLIGTPACPVIIDVRNAEDFAADPRLVPASLRRSHLDVTSWAPDFAGTSVIVVCHHGAKLSHGAAAWLRHAGADAVSLEGGFEAWKAAGLPLLPVEKLPPRDAQGRTHWVTRARPKIDRIACPWLVRRFIDAQARFFYLPTAQVRAVAAAMGAMPYDVNADVAATLFTHDGDACSFDAFIQHYHLRADTALAKLADIVRGADTDRLDLAPQAAGLLAVSLGMSRMMADDLAMLEAMMPFYDALYAWCRDAVAGVDEPHNWKPA